MTPRESRINSINQYIIVKQHGGTIEVKTMPFSDFYLEAAFCEMPGRYIIHLQVAAVRGASKMTTVYLIRHAEKPDKGKQGVDQKGGPDEESLIPRGWQRSGALAIYFGEPGRLPLPDRIYASSDKKERIAKNEKDGSHSKRPMQTISALAARNNLAPIERFKGEEANLARELADWAGSALVCWQHEAIPDIAKHLGVPSVPRAWPDDRFDVIWRFSRDGGPWTFDQICPQLLHGDSKDPIK